MPVLGSHERGFPAHGRIVNTDAIQRLGCPFGSMTVSGGNLSPYDFTCNYSAFPEAMPQGLTGRWAVNWVGLQHIDEDVGIVPDHIPLKALVSYPFPLDIVPPSGGI
jgi:hypothetical protein